MPETLPPLPAQVLPAFLAQLQALFPTLLQGLYLTGSIPLGDYWEGKSDIDFLVLLHEPLPTAQLAQVAALHRALEKKYHSPKLSGYYLTLIGLASPQPHFPSFFAGRLLPHRPFELPRFTLFEWQTTALPLFGPPARGLVPALPLSQVLAELHQNLNDYWQRWIKAHTFPRPGYWQLLLFARLSEWGVLGVARQLYTLDTQRIASKYAAGDYYLNQVPPAYHAIVQLALATRRVSQLRLQPSAARARQTLACMAYLRTAFNQRYAAGNSG